MNALTINNTYVVSSNLVATLRFGWNQFDDNNNLPFDFDAHTLGFNPAFADAMPVQKFPGDDADRLQRHRLHRKVGPEVLLVRLQWHDQQAVRHRTV